MGLVIVERFSHILCTAEPINNENSLYDSPELNNSVNHFFFYD